MSGTVCGAARRLRTSLRVALRTVSLIPLLAIASPLAGQTMVNTVENRAKAQYRDANGNIASAEGAVLIHIDHATSHLTLRKTVDRTATVLGDTVFYTLRVRNIGTGTASNVLLTDTLPQLVEFAPGTVQSSWSTTVTSTSGRAVRFAIGDIAPGDSGTVRFGVLVTGRVGEFTNVASGTYNAGAESRSIVSDTVHTSIEADPTMRIELEALTDRPQHFGDTLTFRIRLFNTSDILNLRNITIVDSLPDALQFLWAEPEEISSQLEGLRADDDTRPTYGGAPAWRFPFLEPLGMIEILVHTRVMRVTEPELRNEVTANGAGVTTAVAAVATVVTDDRFGLRIEKSATTLQVAGGGVAGFAITVENTGSAIATDVFVRDQPAAGYTVQDRSVTGGTFRHVDGQLEFRIGDLGIGQKATVQYVASVQGAAGAQLMNEAWAESADGVRTDTAGVTIRITSSALLSRAAFGKVWLDQNGDGRQQSNERPVSYAVIWTSHGETVRADSLGRFNFPDLDPGRYTFRIDPLSVPDGFANAPAQSVRVDGWTSPTLNFGVKPDVRNVVVAQDSVRSIRLPGGLFVPRPRFAAPFDNEILSSNRLFVRVEGEPMAEVDLFDNDSLIAKSKLLGDGSGEFLGVEMTPGPHILNARIRGAGDEQETSVKVHVSGDPEFVERADTTVLRAGQTQLLALRVMDEWRVPVSQRPLVTVAIAGARLLDSDADASSTGVQLHVGDDGVLLIRMRGDSIGSARVDVMLGTDVVSLPINMLPEIRSFVLIADGEIGVGAASRSYGAATARGALDSRTAVTLSYDSRRTNKDSFGGAFDPLGESRYAVLGDASERAILGSSTTPLSLKVERDRSWLTVGDIDTRSFGGAGSPGSYQRALPGVSASYNVGRIGVSGFGSMVGQQLVQKQLPGNGTSGPYDLGSEIRLGTDRLAVETRDRLNTSRVVLRQELERFVDYDIDFATGSVLLRRPLATVDGAGNPMVLVAIAEQIGGAASFVGGMRAQLGMKLFTGPSDSVKIGTGYIEDRSAIGGHRIATGDFKASADWGGGLIEVARGEMGDSAGVALAASAWAGSRSGTNAMVEWSRVGNGFVNPANPRLLQGTEDLRLSGTAALGAGWTVAGQHSRQWFRAQGSERANANVSLARTVGVKKIALNVGLMDERIDRDSIQKEHTSLTTRLSYSPERNTFWVEAVQSLRSGVQARPNTYGIGAGYDLGFGIRAEASQRIIKTDSTTDGLTTIGLRSSFSTGTRAWTEYQLANSVSGQSSAALVGIGQKLRITSTVSVDAQYEKRAGISKLPETDPNRSVPFGGQERDHWAASLGAEWTPTAVKARIGLRGEINETETHGRGYRIFGSGEAAVTQSLAVLVRQDTRQSSNIQRGGIASRASQTILGAALRPATRSDWNSLIKLEWRNEENPTRGAGLDLVGSDRRVIGAFETIWTPRSQTELSLRVALRHSEAVGALGAGQAVTANTQHAGVRVRQNVTDRFDVRTSARVLSETRSGLTRWDLAPAVGIRLMQGLDLETGYRFGDLKDVDFAQNGGRGFYASMGMSLTENAGRTIADFWRTRIGGGR